MSEGPPIVSLSTVSLGAAVIHIDDLREHIAMEAIESDAFVAPTLVGKPDPGRSPYVDTVVRVDAIDGYPIDDPRHATLYMSLREAKVVAARILMSCWQIEERLRP